MKKASTALLIISSVLVGLISLVLTVIEGRLVLSFDWSLHEHEFLGFIQYLARFGLSLITLIIAYFSIRYNSERTFVFEAALVLAISVATIVFASNGFGIYFTALSALYLGAAIFHKLATDRETAESSKNT